MTETDLEQMLFWVGVYGEEVARVCNVLNYWKWHGNPNAKGVSQ